MSPESSAKIFFDRALNRGRRTESRVLFGYFLHDAKSDNPFSLQRTSRFYKPRFSAQNYNFPLTKLNPFETFRFAESLSLPGRHTSCAFSALRRLFPTFCKVQKVGQKTLKISCRKFYPAGTARSACTAPPKAASQKN